MPYAAPNYSALTEPGTTRRRIWRMTMENALGSVPRCDAHEEEVILSAAGERSIGRTRDLSKTPANPDEVVELRHPVTHALLGHTTIAQIHAMIYSLGHHMQLQDDARRAAAIAEEEAAAAAAADEPTNG